ncbi:peptidoglycan-binding protein [Salininema proteolyticum]|uniref:Peptidoglycan-binding protein n=1 Tax=Salininema proteolyticum TaxID=1607685 RepID=A0ABV8TSW7_9ACTN
MNSWRLARSLERLRDEINALAPGRSTRSDGTIGDRAHQGTASDHNPNAQGVVCAMDITHDPGAGVDIDALTDHLVHPDNRHPSVKYVIANRLIAGIHTGWSWRSYYGSNPHTAHMHISVGRGPDGQSTGPYDDTSTWGIAAPAHDGRGNDVIGLKVGSEGEAVKGLQAALRYAGHSPGEVDGVYGPKTAAAVLAMRKSQGSGVDDGENFTGWAYGQLQMAMAKRYAGKDGARGPAGKDGADGRDGVLELPRDVQISGRITEVD